MSDTMTEPAVNSYPPQGTPIDPADHPATNFPSGSVRMQGIKEELGIMKTNVNSLRKNWGRDPL